MAFDLEAVDLLGAQRGLGQKAGAPAPASQLAEVQGVSDVSGELECLLGLGADGFWPALEPCGSGSTRATSAQQSGRLMLRATSGASSSSGQYPGSPRRARTTPSWHSAHKRGLTNAGGGAFTTNAAASAASTHRPLTRCDWASKQVA